jgi:hypothetical protein
VEATNPPAFHFGRARKPRRFNQQPAIENAFQFFLLGIDLSAEGGKASGKRTGSIFFGVKISFGN